MLRSLSQIYCIVCTNTVGHFCWKGAAEMAVFARSAGAVLLKPQGHLSMLQLICAGSDPLPFARCFTSSGQSTQPFERDVCPAQGALSLKTDKCDDSVSSSGQSATNGTSCQGVPLWAQRSGWYPSSKLLLSPSRSFFSSSSIAEQADAAQRSNKPQRPQPVSWRDFEDIGIWTVDEGAFPTRQQGGGPSGGTPSSRPTERSADSQKTRAPGGRRSEAGRHGGIRSSSGGFLPNPEYGHEGEATTSESDPDNAASIRNQDAESPITSWRDFEDMGTWVVDETEDHRDAAIPSQQARPKGGPNIEARRPQPPKLTPKERKKRKKQIKAGEFVLPRFKGPYFTEEEKKMSYFELCQLPSLRGAAHVPDFLRLSDDDLLAQCEVQTGRTRGGHGRPSSVMLKHRPTELATGCDKTKSVYANTRKALAKLQEMIAIRGEEAKKLCTLRPAAEGFLHRLREPSRKVPNM